MAFSIRTALDSLVTIQESSALDITSPITASIARAYKTFPTQKSLLPDPPCFINIPSLDRMGHVIGSRFMRWRVRSQLLVLDADRDQAADIVLAFLEKYLDALSNAITLDGLPVILTDTTTGELGGFDYGDKSFTGIEVSLALVVPLETKTVGP